MAKPDDGWHRPPIAKVYSPPFDGKIISGEWHFLPYEGTVDSEFSAYILSVFVKAYSRYEKECWNDSTASTKKVLVSINGKLTEVLLGDGWVHRQPSFEGFIQFLRRQR